MAKHPVPKKKVSNARTAKRYAAFAFKKHRKLAAFVRLVKCPSCGNSKLNQKACANCGSFRGRSVIDMGKAVSKITKIKA